MATEGGGYKNVVSSLLASFCRGWASSSSSSFSSSSPTSSLLASLFHLSFRFYFALFPGPCIYLSVWLIEHGESSEAGEMVDLAANLNKYGRTRGTKRADWAAPSETSLRNAWVRTSRRGKFISPSPVPSPPRRLLRFFAAVDPLLRASRARSIDHVDVRVKLFFFFIVIRLSSEPPTMFFS